MGAIDLRVHLNTELLALEFRKHGITVEFATGPAARPHFISATRGYLGAETGETPVIGFEDERPAWVAAGESR